VVAYYRGVCEGHGDRVYVIVPRRGGWVDEIMIRFGSAGNGIGKQRTALLGLVLLFLYISVGSLHLGIRRCWVRCYGPL
jgi:hypothetical protein